MGKAYIPLRLKLTVSYVIALGAVIAFVQWYFPTRMIDLAERKERERVESMAAVLAKASASGFDFGDEIVIGELLEGLEQDKQARFAAVQRADGDTVASWSAKSAGDTWATYIKDPTRVADVNLVVVRPISGLSGSSGRIIVGASRADLVREENQIRSVNLAVSAVLLLVGALLSWVLGSLIARPARRLTEIVTEIVRTRDLTLAIPALSNDEIGDLGAAFAAMVQVQRTTLATIRTLARELTALGSKLDRAGQNVLSGAKAISERVSESGNAARELLGSLGDVGRLTTDLEVRVEESSGTVAEVQGAAQAAATSITDMTGRLSGALSTIAGLDSTVRDTSSMIGDLDGFVKSTSVAMKTIQEAVVTVRQEAHDSRTLGEDMRAQAENGVQVMASTLSGLSAIRESAQNASSAMERLVGRTAQIGEILGVIGDVSEQTNLLAINASIIASSAGESGRAFAVVASEIKQLSGRTADYTERIEHLVNGIEQESQQATRAMRVGLQQVAAGVEQGENTALVFERIFNSSRLSVERMSKIAAQTARQVSLTANVAEAIDVLTQTSQRLTAAGRLQADRSHSLARSTSDMNQISADVQRSTDAQLQLTRRIGHAVSEVGRTAERLSAAQHTQVESSNRVLSGVDVIRAVTKRQEEVVQALDEAIRALRAQANGLEKEVEPYRV